MNEFLWNALVLVSLAIGGVACSASDVDDESEVSLDAPLKNAGPGIWQLNRECGTKETGACAKGVGPCGDGILGGACAAGGSRCLTAPSASGLRKLLVCNPTSNSTWTFNGECHGGCGDKPACDSGTNAGDRCRYPLKRCTKNDRVFVCLTDGKDQFVFSGYCGKNGGPACSGFAACPASGDGVAGLSCIVGTTCQAKIDHLSGKVFTCVSR